MTRWYLSKSSNPKCKPYPNGNLTCRQMINRIVEGLSWILFFEGTTIGGSLIDSSNTPEEANKECTNRVIQTKNKEAR